METINEFWGSYKNTPKFLRIIDVFLAYIVFTGAFQFLYCMIVGTFPFNAFLAGFISTLASFVFAGKKKKNYIK